MHDVLGHVVVAPGDEDLLAAETEAALAVGLRARAQRTEIGSRLWFCQVHRTRPSARNELRKIDAFLAVGAMHAKRLDGTTRQHGAEPQGHVRGMHHLEYGEVDRTRQTLAAKFDRCRKP